MEVYEGVKRLINNRTLKEKFKNKLKSEKLGNEYEIENLYRLIN